MPPIINADTTPAKMPRGIVNHAGKPKLSLRSARGAVKQNPAAIAWDHRESVGPFLNLSQCNVFRHFGWKPVSKA